MKPELIVVGGPNGAGKSTFVEEFRPIYRYPYLSADEILSRVATNDDLFQARITAGRIFIEELRDRIEARSSVVVESTLSGRTMLKHVQAASSKGYFITLVLVFADSPELCLGRIVERVRKGGHPVPERDVKRRYRRSIRNFWEIYRPLCDEWYIWHNADEAFQQIAFGDPAGQHIADEKGYRLFRRGLERVP